MSRARRADVSRLIATALGILTEPIPPRGLASADPSDAGAQSPAMRRVMALAARVAVSDATVLITGGSGAQLESQFRLRFTAEPQDREVEGAGESPGLGDFPVTAGCF